MIVVTGATGQVGGRVAAGLAGRGLRLRLVVRDAARAPDRPGAEACEVRGGYADHDGMAAALAGADTVFLVPAAESADRVEQHRAVVDAAVVAGVGRIVYLSFLGASPDATFTLARDHWATEEFIRATGLPRTILRMSMYMDFLPDMRGPDGAIAGPAGEGRVSFILRDDVAAAAAAVLADPQPHAGETYELTGREALTFSEVAQVTGGSFHDETEEEAYASRATYGAPDWEVRGWVTSYLAAREGELERVTDDVERLTGRPPRTLREHIGQNRVA